MSLAEYEKEKTISDKAALRKLLPEERNWLKTHPAYNQELGYPYLIKDILHLDTNVWYAIKLRIESSDYNDRIIPIISSPAERGQIVPVTELTDLSGNKVLGRPAKSFEFLWEPDNDIIQIKFRSSSGLLAIEYLCDYFDKEANMKIRCRSLSSNFAFAMHKEIIKNNAVRYFCKAPTANKFDALVFTVQWMKYK